jgi:hypothetical protein
MDNTEDTSLSVSLLIPLNSDHRNTGEFRLVVYGGDTDSVPVLAEDLFKDLPDQLKGLYLNLPCSASRLRLPDNSTACLWADAELLIRNVNLIQCLITKIIHYPLSRIRYPNRRFGYRIRDIKYAQIWIPDPELQSGS